MADAPASRIARAATIAGIIALCAASCMRYDSLAPGGHVDRAAKMARDPVEWLISESERRKAEVRELAGRAPAQIDSGARDASISAKAISALSAEPSLSAVEIHVRTKGSVVTLDGMAHTPQGRDQAAQVVMNVPGVRSVRNEIRVEEGP